MPTGISRAYARVTDKLFLMLYDEHWASGDPGPIASQGWFVRRLQEAVRQIGPDKAIATIANYGYDWSPGRPAEALTVEEAWLAARDSEAPIRFDPASGNAAFDYDEDGGRPPCLAARRGQRLEPAARRPSRGRRRRRACGGWAARIPACGAPSPASPAQRLPDLRRIATLTNVDVEGVGRDPADRGRADPGQPPHRRRRQRPDPRPSATTSCPRPIWSGAPATGPALVALTFDDGPDPDWTPAILDVLRDRHVPATFFVVGENALGHPGLLSRIVAEGHELGNHSYTHPNFATISDGEARLELNATERLVEAYTGRGMRLFRAPYFGDAEPTTADELGPALAAQQDGYLNVGLHVDSEDWQRPGVAAIVANTVRAVIAGNAERSRPDRPAPRRRRRPAPRRWRRCRGSSTRCARAATASCRSRRWPG